MANYSDTRAMRLQQVERCLDSGMQIREWCKLNKMAESTFYVWLKVYREESRGREKSNSEWIELTRQSVKDTKALAVKEDNHDAVDVVAAPTPPSVCTTAQPAIQVSLNGAAIAIPCGFDDATIKSVLSAVASL